MSEILDFMVPGGLMVIFALIIVTVRVKQVHRRKAERREAEQSSSPVPAPPWDMDEERKLMYILGGDYTPPVHNGEYWGM